MANAPDSKHSGFWQRIQGKLVLLLLVLLVPTLSIQAFLYFQTLQVRKAEELQANLEIARTVGKAFENFVQDALCYESAIAIAATASSPLSPTDLTRLLEQSVRDIHPMRDCYWFSPQGRVLASSTPGAVGMDGSDRSWFKEITAGRDWVISDLLHSKLTGGPSFAICRGIRNQDGELLGVVVAAIDPDRLDAVLAVERAKGGAISLVDSRGMLVFRHPQLNPTWEERDWTKLFPGIVEDASKGKESTGAVFAPFEGKNRIFALAPTASCGWLAGAGRTEEVAMAAITSTLMPQVMIFLLITLAAFGSALILSRFISSPVKRLRDHALAIGRGETHDPPVASGPAELRELADTFNSMAQALKAREERIEGLARFPDENLNPVLRISETGEILYANRNSSHLMKSLGWESEGKVTPDWLERVRELMRSGEKLEVVAKCADVVYSLSLVPISDSGYVNIYAYDVTERKRMEQEREITLELLKVINHSTETVALVKAAATFFQHESGCEAVGIRIKQGDDFPYFEARGFPEEFIRSENSLCARDAAGNILRDSSGDPYIECMCGNVIMERVDPSKPFFSPSGSFWANSTTRLLATTSDSDRQTRTRNRCNGEGYESVALIPLRLGAERLGLIQLNDRRQNMFSPEIIALWERLAGYLSVAIAEFRTRDQLREQREWLHVTLTSVGDAVIATDTAGRIVFINPVAETLTGWPREEALRQPVHEVFRTLNEETGGPAKDVVNQVLHEGRIVDLANHTALVTRDGREIPIEDSAAPIRDGEGNVSGVVLVFHDVTEKQRAREALKKSEFHLARSQQLAHLGSWSWDIVEDRLYWTDETYRLFGLQPGEVMPRHEDFLDFVHPEDRDRVERAVQNGLVHGRYAPEFRIINKRGRELYIYSNGETTFDKDGNPLKMEGYLQDITERRRMEEELRKSKDELELRVQERTVELERSNQALQDFASIASHDLQEPLRKVATFGNMLRQKTHDTLGQTESDYLNRMLDATQRMQKLIAALLEYSRLATNPEPFGEVDLYDLVHEVLSTLEVRIWNTGGEIQIGELPTIQADPNQMSQLFQNLIGNALKFHREGEKPIVKISCTESDNSNCHIIVQDNGIGFEEQYIEKIFAPFQRLHGKSGKYEGTGMGLAICKKIVERHGGSISTKSTPGKGASFIVRLPMTQNLGI